MKNLIAVGVLGLTIVGGIFGVITYGAEANTNNDVEPKFVVQEKKDAEVTRPVDEKEEVTSHIIKGTITGWIDHQSIEVATESGPMAFRVSEVNTNGFKEHDAVVVKFYENVDGQNIVESISKK
ncbi:hypothetical protein V7112_11620 [Bacillus sp. JJ1566]|uniref:hypothetical protein n=1 Tax=Bacillus sp. JJ1566 TaxID=3122961 RepID=UPI003000C847